MMSSERSRLPASLLGSGKKSWEHDVRVGMELWCLFKLGFLHPVPMWKHRNGGSCHSITSSQTYLASMISYQEGCLPIQELGLHVTMGSKDFPVSFHRIKGRSQAGTGGLTREYIHISPFENCLVFLPLISIYYISTVFLSAIKIYLFWDNEKNYIICLISSMQWTGKIVLVLQYETQSKVLLY